MIFMFIKRGFTFKKDRKTEGMGEAGKKGKRKSDKGRQKEKRRTETGRKRKRGKRRGGRERLS